MPARASFLFLWWRWEGLLRVLLAVLPDLARLWDPDFRARDKGRKWRADDVLGAVALFCFLMRLFLQSFSLIHLLCGLVSLGWRDSSPTHSFAFRDSCSILSRITSHSFLGSALCFFLRSGQYGVAQLRRSFAGTCSSRPLFGFDGFDQRCRRAAVGLLA